MTPGERRNLCAEGTFDHPTAAVSATAMCRPTLRRCPSATEEPLIKAGILLRHGKRRQNVSMYRTRIPLEPSGIFRGEMVVSMRPIHWSQVAEACIIPGRYPSVHGAPVHIKDPQIIGVQDVAHPDYGDPVEILPDEVPVFWACGVTPQNVLVQAKLPFAVTHAPGYMFVGDLKNEEFAQDVCTS